MNKEEIINQLKQEFMMADEELTTAEAEQMAKEAYDNMYKDDECGI